MNDALLKAPSSYRSFQEVNAETIVEQNLERRNQLDIIASTCRDLV